MQPENPFFGPAARFRGSLCAAPRRTRAVIGGIAWVTQYLPPWTKKKQTSPNARPAVTQLLEFPRSIAQWDEQKPDENKDAATPKEKIFSKDFEVGTKGHYDFPFKNISREDVEIIHYVSTCDCTSIQVCALPITQWIKVAEQQKQKPGEPLTYDSEPTWLDLQSEREQAGNIDPKKILTVKADEGGVVRLRWTVKKTPGQILNLKPQVVFRPAGVTDGEARRHKRSASP